MSNERRVVRYSGRVQGVGFRWRTFEAVHDLPVTGYVQNLADGRVELVLEGASADTTAALDRVRKQLGDLIAGLEESASDATGEFHGFGVRR